MLDSEILSAITREMYAFFKLASFCPCLLSLWLAATLTAGCSPAGDDENRKARAQPHDPVASGHAAGHGAAAGGHPQPVSATQSTNDQDLGWSRLQNGHEHSGEAPKQWEELPAEVRARLAHQLALTRRVSKRFPTLGAAEAAGYRRQGHYSPGVGVHYRGPALPNTTGTLSDEEVLHPTHLIFSGDAKSSRLAGFMYLSRYQKGPIEGFAGPYDNWHGHTGLCTKNGEEGELVTLGFDGSITREQCEGSGATYIDRTIAMLHVWTVPSFKNRLGVFSNLNPALKCPDGTYQFKGTAKHCRT